MPTAETSFQQVLADYRNRIDKALAEYFNSDTSKLGLGLQEQEMGAFDALAEFSRRPGKRLRGALALFSYEQFAGSANPSAMNLALAMELVQNYLLIVDDVMDRSASRRGLPSTYRQFQEKFKVTEHMAGMMAVNVGIIAQHMATDLICSIDEQSANIQAATAVFHKNIAATAYGQFDDLFNEATHDFGEPELIRLYELKNSHYTFINPLQVGAILAGAGDQKTLAQLAAVGLPAGVAFQLHDDILGLFGEQKTTGKSAMDDLREGKQTLLMRYALDKASASDAEIIKSALGNPDVTEQMHEKVKQIVDDCGAKKMVEEKAQSYCAEAQTALTEASFFDEPAKAFLSDVINFVVSRKA